MFEAVNEEWFPRLATDLEMLGYSVLETLGDPPTGIDNGTEFMQIEWAKAARIGARTCSFKTFMNQKMCEIDSDSEMSDY